MSKCYAYFLIYRMRRLSDGTLRIGEVLGGLEMLPKIIVDGHPVGDWRLARDIAWQRYEFAPGERPVVCEVIDGDCLREAKRLADAYEIETKAFVEWMRG